MSGFVVTYEDVERAAKQIEGVAVRTPLLEFAALNARAGQRVLVKFEGAQRTGSFKFRGAYNRLSRLTEQERKAGVVAWSSGNHAQGVAAAAQLLAMPAAIVMPADAPTIKIANTRAYGAEVVLYDRYTQSREEIATKLAQQRGAVLVPSFDDPHIIAGQGTVGREILQQSAALGAEVDRVLVCCGGGGLLAGTATGIKASHPEIKLYSVEPADFDDTARSLQTGQREHVKAGAQSICDALQAPSPGKLTFPINQALVSGGLTVTDDEVRAAIRFAFASMKLVVEPGGAVALAAVLAAKLPVSDKACAIVISGANVDPSFYSALLKE
ncbi:threonine ammonia-lyase [Acetobacter cibinongensis]|uniref:Pyridoxal-5'-phosphate-dependent protein n=1 Tax=Acetobacter cibinongensis TaxID=146475 RepID=A0A1Z5YTI4_9PROT|nr:threonine/serine dehydratase [Acetobacter cibinongensis]OUJ01647.1 pyridoxal-5'-phosphate-dependent protein [Acetobacter cibinongensis]